MSNLKSRSFFNLIFGHASLQIKICNLHSKMCFDSSFIDLIIVEIETNVLKIPSIQQSGGKEHVG